MVMAQRNEKLNTHSPPQVEDSNNLGHAHIRRELLQSLKRAVVELEMDSDLADRWIEPLTLHSIH